MFTLSIEFAKTTKVIAGIDIHVFVKFSGSYVGDMNIKVCGLTWSVEKN